MKRKQKQLEKKWAKEAKLEAEKEAQRVAKIKAEADAQKEIAAAFMGALQEEAQKNGINLGQPPAEKQRNFDDLKDLGEVWRRFI